MCKPVLKFFLSRWPVVIEKSREKKTKKTFKTEQKEQKYKISNLLLALPYVTKNFDLKEEIIPICFLLTF